MYSADFAWSLKELHQGGKKGLSQDETEVPSSVFFLLLWVPGPQGLLLLTFLAFYLAVGGCLVDICA